MSADVVTVIWKEWLEFREQLFSFRRGGLAAIILALVLGVVAPMQMGVAWVHSDFMIAYWPFLAASMVTSLIADSIAGERERHTLETLLASRLSDTSILVGKVTAAVLYGVAFAVVNLVVGLIAVNIAFHEDGVILFRTRHFIATVGLTTLASAFVAGVGVFISLRAATVKQAQQTFGIGMVVLIFAPALFFQSLSVERKQQLVTGVTRVGGEQIQLYAAGVLALLTLLSVGGALLRFRRGKLVLD